jgi:hypothetical protein
VRTYPVPSRHGVLSAEAIGAPVWRAAVGELRRLETYPALGFISPQPIPESVREAARGLIAGIA